jgi:hypothetical protein
VISPNEEATMAYIAKDLDIRDKSKSVGSGQCVALVQAWTGAPSTGVWTEGVKVKGNHTLDKGTAIATFVNGHYPNHSTGNHAAIYISQDEQGIRVVDQWSGHTPSERILHFRGGSGSASNDGDAFSVIE